jgi:hypothetical protein
LCLPDREVYISRASGGFFFWLNYFSKWLNKCFLGFKSPNFENFNNFFFKKVTKFREYFKIFFLKIARFLYSVLTFCSQKCEGYLNIFLLSFLVCSQIWLNFLMDNRHFSHITKMKKKQKNRKLRRPSNSRSVECPALSPHTSSDRWNRFPPDS